MVRSRRDFGKEAVELLKSLSTPSQPTAPLDVTHLATMVQEHPLASKILSILLSKERDAYLHENSDDSANGYYGRSLQSAMGNLEMEVPRTRSGTFRSELLPKRWIRGDSSFEEFLKDLLVGGFSRQRIKQILKLRGQSFPEELVDELCDEIEKEFQQITTRQLPEELMALIIDCNVFIHSG